MNLVIRMQHAYKSRVLNWADGLTEIVLKESELFVFFGSFELFDLLLKNKSLCHSVQSATLAIACCKDRNELLNKCAELLNEDASYKLIVRGDTTLKHFLLKRIPEHIHLTQRDHSHTVTIETTQSGLFFIGISLAGKEFHKPEFPTNKCCRSYFKIAEAVKLWSPLFHALHEGNILDIGAAPGGWTQYCLEDAKATKVIAIDPAILHLPTKENYIHFRKRIQDSAPDLSHLNIHFDAILCDANSHPNAAVRSFLPIIHPYLRPGITVLLLTLKQTNITQKDAHISTGFSQVIHTLAQFGFDLDLKFTWLWANSRKERTLFVRYRGDPSFTITTTTKTASISEDDGTTT